MKKNLAIATFITLALVIIGFVLAEVAASAPLSALPPRCSATQKTDCLLYINQNGRPVPNTISATVADGAVLTINNTASGAGFEKGIYATGEWAGVHGYTPTGYGVWGTGLYGVVGTSSNGTGVYAYSSSGLPLYLNTDTGSDLIVAWEDANKVRFKVTRSGLLMPGKLSSPPACGASTEGGIYYDTDDDTFYGCNGSTWQPLN